MGDGGKYGIRIRVKIGMRGLHQGGVEVHPRP